MWNPMMGLGIGFGAPVVEAPTPTLSDNESNMAEAFDQILTEFGETVNYIPRVGQNRSITVLVDRESVTDVAGLNYGRAPELTILVKNSATAGITADEIDTGGDKIELAIREGESAQERRITNISFNDATSLTIGLQ